MADKEDEKLDAVKSMLDSLHKKMDAESEERKKDSARLDAVCMKQDAADKEKADAAVKMKADAEKADADKAKADADKLKADADKEKEDREKADAAKAKADADKAKADADAIALGHTNVAKELDELKRRMPAILSAEDRNKYAEAQLRLDSACQAWGRQARAPLHGESLRNYRINLLKDLQPHSRAYKDSDLASVVDEAVFSNVEAAIINDSIAASNVHIAPGAPLTKRTRVNESGHKITTWHGDAAIAWAPFMGGGTQFGKINNQAR
jgi:hypothetical protein